MPPETERVERERDPTFRVPEIVLDAPFTMSPPEIYLEVEVELVVVEFVPVKFVTLRRVDDAVEVRPL